MKKTILIIIGLFLLVPMAFATEGQDICNYLINDSGLKVGVNISESLPYTNEVMNGYTKSGEVIGHITLQNKQVISLDCVIADDPTYNVYVQSLSTITDISNATSQIDALNEKLGNGELEIQGTSVGKKVKGFFTRVGIWIAHFFD